jgi:hypothetical protein
MSARGGVWTRRPRSLAVLCALGATTGCGSPPPPDAPPTPPAPDRDRGAQSVAIESEIGALDEGKVRQAFERATPELLACFKQGLEKVPYLAGQVRIALRIDRTGHARVAYFKESTLGDRATEDCMLAAAKGALWPKPVGGREGLAETTLDFPPTGDERPPVEWKPSNLGHKLRAVKSAIASCRAGAGAIDATLYVDTDGRALAVGVASADEKGDAAAACIVEKLKRMPLPSPGSYAAKVTVHAD